MRMKEEMKPVSKIVMGMGLKEHLAGTTFGYRTEVMPKFSVREENISIYGEYEDGGIAFALKEFGDFNLCYTGAGTIPYLVLREMARNAGVHIYYEGNDPVFVNSRLIGVHHVKDRDTVIHLPGEYSGEMLFGDASVATNNRKMELKLQYGEMNAVLLNKPVLL
jgi:hypothetical protein